MLTRIHHSKWRSQRGATLLIALIMLVIMTLLAVTSFNMGNTNLKIVANAQEQQRVRDISERLMNDRLHKIGDSLSSNPCDETALAAADGTLTETIEGVEVKFSRSLIRASCITNQTIKSDWAAGLEAVKTALQTFDEECPEGTETDACEKAEADLDTEKTKRDRAKRRLDECLRKPPTTTSLSITDPALEADGADEEAAVAEGEKVNEHSYCVDVVMELRAEATDTASKARAVIVRGLALQCSNHDIPEC